MEKALARAKAYVAYAQAHPGMYGLMFRTERLDMTRPSLHEAADASFAGLAGAIGASRQEQISEAALSLEQAAAHRARLVAGPRLHHAAARRPPDRHPATGCPKGTDAETLLDAMLKSRHRAAAGWRHDQRRVASSTARPLAPITFTWSVPHLKSRAISSAAWRASSLAFGLAATST